MTKNQKLFLIGLSAVAVAAIALDSPHCKGACRSIAGQLESIGVKDILTVLFG